MDALKVCRSSSGGIFIETLQYTIGGVYGRYGPVVITGIGFEPSFLLIMNIRTGTLDSPYHGPFIFDKTMSSDSMFAYGVSNDKFDNIIFTRSYNRDEVYNNNTALDALNSYMFYMDANEVIINGRSVSAWFSTYIMTQYVYIVAYK